MSGQVDPTHAGQAIYNPATLALYDFVVLGISNRLIWRCPTHRILELYNQHVTGNHLDVGVGTGWYLDHCRFPSSDVRLGLMDLNRDSLRKAAGRLRRYRPEVYRADVLKPLQIDVKRFRSVSMTYLLHCLPGAINQKAVVFDHLTSVLGPGGVLFGATLLSSGVERTGPARALMRIYNSQGVFSNEEDSSDALRHELASRFKRVRLEVIGCAALFSAEV
jgi:ubiquinone/menaquinone biosynthesis C-methylase UbiE